MVRPDLIPISVARPLRMNVSQIFDLPISIHTHCREALQNGAAREFTPKTEQSQ